MLHMKSSRIKKNVKQIKIKIKMKAFNKFSISYKKIYN